MRRCRRGLSRRWLSIRSCRAGCAPTAPLRVGSVWSMTTAMSTRSMSRVARSGRSRLAAVSSVPCAPTVPSRVAVVASRCFPIRRRARIVLSRRVRGCPVACRTAAAWSAGGGGRNEVTEPGGAFSAIAAGELHACGLRTDKRIDCWGFHSSPPRGLTRAPGGNFSAVSVGRQFSCGVHTSGAISCWGYNPLLDGDGEPRYESGPADAPGGEFVSVSAGRFHSCGLRADDTVGCWGSDYFGQVSAPRGEFR